MCETGLNIGCETGLNIGRGCVTQASELAPYV